jgi:hypothetical protein
MQVIRNVLDNYKKEMKELCKKEVMIFDMYKGCCVFDNKMSVLLKPSCNISKELSKLYVEQVELLSWEYNIERNKLYFVVTSAFKK